MIVVTVVAAAVKGILKNHPYFPCPCLHLVSTPGLMFVFMFMRNRDL